MIFADIRGKIGSDSRLSERREDVLTSTVFGLLRYVRDEEGLLPLLRLARRVELGERGVTAEAQGWLPVERWKRCDVHFWPRYGEYGEPDLRVEVFGESNVPQAVLFIEAKYLSAKSGVAGEGETYEPSLPDGDQLVKYSQVLDAESAKGVFTAVIYLTAHAAPPIEELAASVERRRDARFGWLSWRDVWRIAHELHRTTPGNRPMEDLQLLLRHKGLKPFTGFSTESIGRLPTKRLFGRSYFFRSTFAGRMPNTRLWRPR